MNRLVLIDGKSVFYRGYYAMGSLSLADGTPTGGVYGFAAISMEIVKKLNPTKVVVAWDSKTSTAKRKALYKDYKAGRVKPGEDFYTQIPLLKDLIKSLGWAFVELDNYEADDIIGTMTRRFAVPSYVVTGDRDMWQLVDDKTTVLFTKKGITEVETITPDYLLRQYGLTPQQVVEFKALRGDTSDNIPGVKGVS